MREGSGGGHAVVGGGRAPPQPPPPRRRSSRAAAAAQPQPQPWLCVSISFKPTQVVMRNNDIKNFHNHDSFSVQFFLVSTYGDLPDSGLLRQEVHLEGRSVHMVTNTFWVIYYELQVGVQGCFFSATSRHFRFINHQCSNPYGNNLVRRSEVPKGYLISSHRFAVPLWNLNLNCHLSCCPPSCGRKLLGSRSSSCSARTPRTPQSRSCSLRAIAFRLISSSLVLAVRTRPAAPRLTSAPLPAPLWLL